MANTIIEIPVGEIYPNPDQPRKTFAKASLQELAASIREHGIIQPIEVEKTDDGYMIHHGERRWRAAALARLETIPSIVKDGLDEQTLLERALVENIQREDMNPIELALACQQLRQQGMSVMEIARRLGKSQATISNHLEWLVVDKAIQDMVASGDLPRDRRVREAIMSVPDNVRVAFAKKCRSLNIPGVVKAAEVLNKSLAGRDEARKRPQKKKCEKRGKARRAHSLTLVLDDCPFPGAMSEVFERVAQVTCEGCPLFEHKPGPSCHECPATKIVQGMVEAVNGSR